MPTRWERLAGDTDIFAIKLAFMDDPDGGKGADEDLWRSWGAFQIWVKGTNLCSHLEESERVESVHWYLLPLLEWIAKSWDPLLHEERLPCANNAEDGWRALLANRFPSPALNQEQEDGWDTWWHRWWSRHAIAAASEGGLFPDVVFRRYRDLVEISWGDTRSSGMPDHFSFTAAGPDAVRLSPQDVAVPLYDVLRAAAECLAGALPDSVRVRELGRALRRIDTNRLDGRLMWLAGTGTDRVGVERGWRRLKRWYAELPAPQKSAMFATGGTSRIVVEGSCHAALMFGSVSPDITKADMLVLAGALVQLHTTDHEPEPLASMSRTVPLDTGTAPWAQGYDLAEQVLAALDETETTALDIERLLTRLGIEVLTITLTDTSVRGLAVVGPHHRPGIAWNSTCSYNANPAGRRFTLAHELCHILFDREVGRRLAIVSGRWAPLGTEQRANAFAAMLLMPMETVRRAVSAQKGPIQTAVDVAAVATRLGTGFVATLRHLRNLSIIDEFDSERIEAEYQPTIDD